MDHLEVLLDGYASADETGRLHLFLKHRQFRDSFMQIELEELSDAPRKRVARPFFRWLDRLQSSLEAI